MKNCLISDSVCPSHFPAATAASAGQLEAVAGISGMLATGFTATVGFSPILILLTSWKASRNNKAPTAGLFCSRN
ncbi:MAG TPA: hypothetical protein VGS78_05990 [Candidatus Sulfotelmatobacter sp.]|nr:hypothetical protein [Candidatus Sulfotelmatobacter sp.]